MQSLECVELLLFVLLPKMSVPDIKNRGLDVVAVPLRNYQTISRASSSLCICVN